MARSGTYTFTITRDEIINAAFRAIGVLDPEGGTATATQITNGAQALNFLVKSWQAHGLNLWKRQMVSIVLTAATASYVLGTTTSTPRPTRILDGYVRSSTGNDTPIKILSREEYNRFGLKTATGTVVSIYYDPQLDDGRVYVYPVPSTTSGTLILEAEYPIMDFTDEGDNPDFPQEWFNALKWNLAAELAPEYGMNTMRIGMITNKAKDELDKVSDFDVEYGSSVFLSPHLYG